MGLSILQVVWAAARSEHLLLYAHAAGRQQAASVSAACPRRRPATGYADGCRAQPGGQQLEVQGPGHKELLQHRLMVVFAVG
jgi:hypothetical protein